MGVSYHANPHLSNMGNPYPVIDFIYDCTRFLLRSHIFTLAGLPCRARVRRPVSGRPSRARPKADCPAAEIAV